MQLVNIYNQGRIIYLFCRDKKGNLTVKKEDSFFPYFYQPYPEGKFVGIDGTKLRKIYVTSPSDVPKVRNERSYEADIIYTKRFLIDRIDEIEETKIKYFFVDIEVLTDEFPDLKKAEKPIACITVYNSYSKEYITFYLGDYLRGKIIGDNENYLLQDFIHYIQREKPDILMGWNFINFDYVYLYTRIETLKDNLQFPPGQSFASMISPIGKARRGIDEVLYPAGISIVDYMAWFKKVVKGLRSYSLDNVAQEILGKDKKKKVDFSKLSPELKAKNIEDVEDMVKTEEKYKLISQNDRIRRFSKVEWEDFGWNSRIIDMLLLQEAKEKKVILPMKPKRDGLKKKKEFEGAFREAYKTGRFFDVNKYDLSGAYMYTIIDLCLDSANITDQIITGIKQNNRLAINVTDRKTEQVIATYWIRQNPNALLPSVAKKLVDEKNKLKELKKSTNPESPEYKSIEEKYEAVKGVVLSVWGVIGNEYFRRYDSRVASMITSVVRDLLHFVRDKLKELGYELIYVDTDGIIVGGKEVTTNLLNKWAKEWAISKFGKELNIEFEYEGKFEKLLIIAMCHYIGYLNTGKGIKKEIKGVEVKRSSSARYEAKFQEMQIDKILDKKLQDEELQEQILGWIKEEVKNFRNLSIFDISYPVKLSKKVEEYKAKSIHVKALLNTQKVNPKFKKKKGDPYYYAYVITEDRVLAFDEDNPIDTKIIDYDKMLERNIYNKCRAIFLALGWEKGMEQLIGENFGKTKKKKSQVDNKNTLARFIKEENNG